MEKLRDLKWNETYTWLWLNSDAIFEWTDDDFDKKARELRDNGITTAIIFSSTHFRFSFVPWWDDIIRCLSRITEACHRYGIKVVEHSSSELTYTPLNDEDWERVDFWNIVSGDKSIYEFPDIVEFLTTDPVLGGTPISSWRQINGQTGEWQRSPYSGYGLCYNNPDYRRVYFDYLRRVFATGIDGIMNDDIQYYGEACACEHCRRLFAEQTGYTLPDQEQWTSFYGNYDDPAFIAFLKFKMDSTTRFYEDIVALEKECGVHMLRPNYISNILLGNWSSLPVESVIKHCSNFFVENILASIIRYSFPAYIPEMIHRYSLAERYDIPAMSLFYPAREDEIYFAWALSHTFGHMYTASGSGRMLNLTHIEKKYRDFEKKYTALYWNPKKVADMAIYQSVSTRDFTDHKLWERRPWEVWCQAACFSGLQVDMLFGQESLDELKKQKMIVLPCIKMLSDDELTKLHNYAVSGGKLLVIGECGVLDENGFPRDSERVMDVLGNANVKYVNWEHRAELFLLETLKSSGKDALPMFNNTLPELRATLGKLLNEELPCEPRVAISEKYLTGLYAVENGYTLHIMTLKDVLPEEPCTVSNADLIPGYSEGEMVAEDIMVSCCIPDEIRNICLCSPTVEGSVDLHFEKNGDKIHFCIPKNTFGGYALIKMN